MAASILYTQPVYTDIYCFKALKNNIGISHFVSNFDLIRIQIFSRNEIQLHTISHVLIVNVQCE